VKRAVARLNERRLRVFVHELRLLRETAGLGVLSVSHPFFIRSVDPMFHEPEWDELCCLQSVVRMFDAQPHRKLGDTEFARGLRVWATTQRSQDRFPLVPRKRRETRLHRFATLNQLVRRFAATEAETLEHDVGVCLFVRAAVSARAVPVRADTAATRDLYGTSWQIVCLIQQ